MVTKTKLRAEESNKPQTNVTWNDVGETKPRYSTPRAKTDKLEEPVNRELNVTRS